MAQEEGLVLSTQPKAGDIIKAGDTVYLTVSLGMGGDDVSMPDFEGLNEAEALLLIAENRLKVGKVTYKYSSKEAAGTIISQSIEKETGVYYNTEVDFTVSLGEKKQTKVTESTTKDTEPAPDTVEITETKDTSEPDSSTADTDDEPITAETTVDPSEVTSEEITEPPEEPIEPERDRR